MSAKFSQGFKIQAVEKALNRADSKSAEEVTLSIGVARSTLHRWIGEAAQQKFNGKPDVENRMSKEKRPHDWNPEEKLNKVIRCGSLDEVAIAKLCREQGIYLHHIEQWKRDFFGGSTSNVPSKNAPEMRDLKTENKTLKKAWIQLASAIGVQFQTVLDSECQSPNIFSVGHLVCP
jgi:transposase